MSCDPSTPSPRQARPLRRVGPALLMLSLGALISWEGQAKRGEDAPPPPEGAAAGGEGPPPGAPEVWVTAFIDATLVPANDALFGLSTEARVEGATVESRRVGRCDSIESQRGRCVEFVRFLPPGATLTDKPDQQPLSASLTLALRDNLSSLFLGLWDGAVARWSREGEPLGAALADQQVIGLPDSDTLWGRSSVMNNRLTALPDPERWLLEDQWIQPRDRRGPSFAPFRHVRYQSTARAKESVTPPPPHLVLMRGRFAENIIFQQRPFDTDLISLADDGGLVFLRQIHPHALDELSARVINQADCVESSEPLACFRGPPPASGSPLLLSGDSLSAEGAEAAAHDQFITFTDLLGMRLLQYGRHEYDISLARVLGALVAMAAPPRATAQAQLDVIVQNISTPGGTDDQTAVRPAPPLSIGETRATSIQYDAMPKELIDELLVELELDGDERCLTSGVVAPRGDAEDAMEPLLYNTLDLIERHLDDKSPLNGGQALTDKEQAAWRVAANAWIGRSDAELRAELLTGGHLKAQQEDVLSETLDRLVVQRRLEGQCEVTLGELVRSDPTQAARERAKLYQERLRGRALIAQVRMALVERFPTSAAAPATPNELEQAADKSWVEVMSLHGSPPTLAEQRGTENVSPIAVCTTTSREQAPDQAVFKRVSVEMLFVAHAKTDPDDALWEARAASPFLWVDDPVKSRPQVERLVALADDLAIYKARWELWSGWHLLWGVQTDPERLSATLTTRAAAICEDMVLAPPTLVPTLVRAGLLDAPLRGTTPVSRADARAQRPGERTRDARSNDERMEQATAAAGELGATINEAELTQLQVQASPEDVLKLADGKIKGREEGEPTDPSANRPKIGANDPSEYLRRLIQEPLLRRAQGRPAVIFAVDSTIVKGRSNARQVLPSTPYQHRRARLGKRSWLHSAAWALFLPALPPELLTPNVPLLPARLPNASVKSSTARPGFNHDPVTELTLVADVGMFPFRSVTSLCAPERYPAGHPGVEDCPNPDLGGDLSDLTYDPKTGHIVQTPVRSFGPTLSVASLGTTWIGHDPRFAFEYGAEAQLDLVLTEVERGAPADTVYPIDDDPELSYALAPRAGLLIGVRFAPDPVWTTRYVRDRRLENKKSLPRLWGAEGDDGRSQLTRAQLGLRAGASYEPWTPGGAPLVLSAEGWMGWSQWRRRSPWAPYTPYQPNGLIGPYLRYQYSVPLDSAAIVDAQYLDHRHQVMFGLRVQPRFDAARFQTPEVE
jgi:hypothetical protein